MKNNLSERLPEPQHPKEFYISEVRKIMQVRKRGKVPMALVHTYGCQQNVADSEKIKGFLAQMGFSFTEDEEEADFILFNTCAVRGHAENRVFGNVGALKDLKRRHPSLIISLCGCMMEEKQASEHIKQKFPFVNLVFGTHVLHRFPELLWTALTASRRVFERGDEQEDARIVEGLPIHRDGTTRAWLTVMYGCDNFCSYCIVPYVRGRERSREPEAILDEFRSIVADGYKDITLLGQNVNSYGKKLERPINFSQLLRMLDAVDGDYRLRFMTSHPKDATHELIDTMAEGRHICHHLHLPVQAGSNRILKEMNRGYTREKYLALVEYARKKIPDLSLTTDIIVGFPGETYEEFRETVSLVREVGFTSLFTFIYSPREGTRAARLPDPVPYEEKARWLQELCAEQEKISAERCAKEVGKTYRVLVEKQNEKDGLLCGRTDGNVIVLFEGSKELIGNFAEVKITAARNWILRGELIQ
ncbi:tRNA (N6-isopentenyl adenosine(37)-C2)-methylthiotransferase MiaB [Thermocaproicibacter melissae]|uniref:tRNA (N6-isopentenyl adenosine(37)-C2)-methylthiotransferase MiaB n=1 Tax=Thermocaproicibacter melissae TaxID=2966552 RepID=UPI0024B1FEA4|nr:tRNA (N6-isopentenyl adenosine(37)-C2)-methylthiotransferase MiaB [Thermocaproicibacter melissae]WBY64977.1 tRNA (N6-isopentenyl adenosine(37)-C2)-methylthiotransferase MiaB [Thermocaproicibacter melissae]